MNLPRWRASTLARYIEERGCILTEWADDEPEEAVFVHTLGWGARAWQHEGEADTKPESEALTGTEAAILAWLRENGASRRLDVARALWRFGGRPTISRELERMERSRKVCRLVDGRYRAA